MASGGRKKKRAAAGSGYQVFLSHATEDKWIVMQIEEKLHVEGIATFRDDRDVAGGVKFPEELREQLKRSRECLVLWTPQAMNSEWVKMEVGMAYALELHIVPVLYMMQADSLPQVIGHTNALQLTSVDVTKYVEQVIQRAKEFHRE